MHDEMLVDPAQAADEPVVAAPGGVQPTDDHAQQPEVVVSFGDEPADASAEEQPAPAWVKKVRQRNRELERELRDIRKKLLDTSAAADQEVGEKPTLQNYDYDAGQYEQALSTWYDRKRAADEKAAAAKAESARAAQEWQARLASYQQAKHAFGAGDFDETESVVTDILDHTQQGIIVHGANDAALVVYALGKNEDKARELAAIKDPVKFAFAVAKLEAQLKVTTRKPSTPPEARLVGGGSSAVAIDKTLDRLREEAVKTGDYTKVAAYKRSKRS